MVIVPLASFALCALGVVRLYRSEAIRSAKVGLLLRGAVALMLLCTAIGAGFFISKLRKAEPPYAAFVRANLAPGQLYLTPVGREEFRLFTGAPQYVSFKSHPYRDVEVLEWYRRLEAARQVYRGKEMDCAQLKRLAEHEAITHVLVMAWVASPSCPFARQVFESGATKIFALSTGRSPG